MHKYFKHVDEITDVELKDASDKTNMSRDELLTRYKDFLSEQFNAHQERTGHNALMEYSTVTLIKDEITREFHIDAPYNFTLAGFGISGRFVGTFVSIDDFLIRTTWTVTLAGIQVASGEFELTPNNVKFCRDDSIFGLGVEWCIGTKDHGRHIDICLWGKVKIPFKDFRFDVCLLHLG